MVVKTINNDDANSAPGVSVLAGAPLAVKFVVTNTGDVRLAPVTLTDDPVDGLSCQVSELAPGASMECTGTLPGLAAGATHLDTVTATGTPVVADGTPVLGVDGQPIRSVQDSDPAHAFAPATAGVSIVKSINGDDANTAPGVSVAAGAPLTVTFVVTNTGTSFLANVAVTDSLATGITCAGAEDDPECHPVVGSGGFRRIRHGGDVYGDGCGLGAWCHPRGHRVGVWDSGVGGWVDSGVGCRWSAVGCRRRTPTLRMRTRRRRRV
jgi:uncharacterized repeat protein (TIGR01451 family)